MQDAGLTSTYDCVTAPEACVAPVPQAGVTDDIPVHVLGGNIVPLATPPAGAPFNTTAEARGAPLTLLVALPGPPGPPAQQRCGDACAAGAAACGSMYLDAGEELEVGIARDNFFNFTASLVRLLHLQRTDRFRCCRPADCERSPDCKAGNICDSIPTSPLP